MKKYAAWDIEIYKQLGSNFDNWSDQVPLGITCASVCYTADGEDPVHETWWAGKGSGQIHDWMGRDELTAMLSFLDGLVERGYLIFTWNGLSFDWHVLYHELDNPASKANIKQHALAHCDMMFQFFCEKGYPLGLDAVAKGMGLAGKTAGMDGSLAPILWSADEVALTQRGLFRFANMSLVDRREKVVEYVEQDALTTYQIAQRAGLLHRWNWTSRSGKPQIYNISRWMTTHEAMKLPLPDTSWMGRPMRRERFYRWLEE